MIFNATIPNLGVMKHGHDRSLKAQRFTEKFSKMIKEQMKLSLCKYYGCLS
jgi:hypothetical protein